MHLRNSIFIVLLCVLFTSCDDSLLNLKPQDKLTADSYFETEDELKTYTNSFYSIVPGWSDIWNKFADNAAYTFVPDRILGTRLAPASGGGWDWDQLRNINFFLKNTENRPEISTFKNKYVGLARFFRAWFYFKKVKRFGDVPWYSEVIGTNDEELLKKSRDSRKLIMDTILADIDFAINNLGTQKDVAEVTKWTALALKSRIFLFEGTYRKYHQLGDYKEYLEESVSASEKLIESGEYKIYTANGDINHAYRKLFSDADAKSEEIILAQIYDLSVPRTHQVNFRTNSSSYRSGVTKEVVDSYLMTDGSRFTDIPGYETLTFYDECTNRDPRLAQTIRTPGYTKVGSNEPSLPDFNSTLTGFQYIKFLETPEQHFFDSRDCDNDLSVLRYAEVLLNFAEGKAELGKLTQSDIDKSIKLLRDRVGMPKLKMAYANSNPDPFLERQYPNVSGSNEGVILEIRRERRIELIREGLRWDDLMRWEVGSKVAENFYGLYFPGAGKYDLDGDGSFDLVIYEGSKPSNTQSGVQYVDIDQLDLENGKNGGRILANGGNRVLGKNWESPKDYLYPIPLQELQLNPNLEQNPGWPSK